MLPLASRRSSTGLMSNFSYWASRTPRATFSKSQKRAMLAVSLGAAMGFSQLSGKAEYTCLPDADAPECREAGIMAAHRTDRPDARRTSSATPPVRSATGENHPTSRYAAANRDQCADFRADAQCRRRTVAFEQWRATG